MFPTVYYRLSLGPERAKLESQPPLTVKVKNDDAVTLGVFTREIFSSISYVPSTTVSSSRNSIVCPEIFRKLGTWPGETNSINLSPQKEIPSYSPFSMLI